MPITTNGLEFKQYYNDKTIWPEGSYHEEDEITINGISFDEITEDNIKDEDIVIIKNGTVCFSDKNPISMEKHFQNWQKAQTTTTFVVQVLKEKAESFSKIIKENGGKIIK